MLISRHEYQICADYHQFYLEDEKSPHNTGGVWNEKTIGQMLAVEEGLVAVSTARNETVPVTIEIYDSEPSLELGNYSRANECSLEVTTDKIIISGCTDYLPDAERIKIEPGFYRVRVLYGNLESVTEEWEGEDFYILQLWRDAEMREISTLKPESANL